MNKSTNTDQRSFPHQFILVLAAVAAVCYGIAYANYSNGEMYYSAYIDAYLDCVNSPLLAAEAIAGCNTAPVVSELLAAHDNAYDSLGAFLTFALSVTAAVLLSPLTHRGSRWVEDRMAAGQRSKPSAVAAS